MTQEQKQNTVFRTISLVIILVVIGMVTTIGLIQKQLKKEVDVQKELINYSFWIRCIEESDGSDIDCEECDVKYNPNNLDFDMDGSKVTFQPRIVKQ